MSGITAVIPNWNRRDLTVRLIRLLREQTCPPDEVVVVDNGSSDGSGEAACAAGARMIALGENRGFAAAVNRGIEETRTSLVAVINNDVMPARNWLEELSKALEQPRAWFAAGKLRNAANPEWLDGTYDAVCRGGCAWRAGQGFQDGPQWSQARTIRLAPFTAALFRVELFHRIGLLDERFGSYLEDVDFGLRAAVEGCFGLYVPQAEAKHEGSATLGRWHKEVVRLNARNQVLILAKHYPGRYLLRYGWPVLVAQTLWGLLATAHGHPLAFAKGKAQGLRLFWRVRREVKRKGPWPSGLSRTLEEGESEIFHLQRQEGFDMYWRLYFALTSFV